MRTRGSTRRGLLRAEAYRSHAAGRPSLCRCLYLVLLGLLSLIYGFHVRLQRSTRHMKRSPTQTAGRRCRSGAMELHGKPRRGGRWTASGSSRSKSWSRESGAKTRNMLLFFSASAVLPWLLPLLQAPRLLWAPMMLLSVLAAPGLRWRSSSRRRRSGSSESGPAERSPV